MSFSFSNRETKEQSQVTQLREERVYLRLQFLVLYEGKIWKELMAEILRKELKQKVERHTAYWLAVRALI